MVAGDAVLLKSVGWVGGLGEVGGGAWSYIYIQTTQAIQQQYVPIYNLWCCAGSSIKKNPQLKVMLASRTVKCDFTAGK